MHRNDDALPVSIANKEYNPYGNVISGKASLRLGHGSVGVHQKRTDPQATACITTDKCIIILQHYYV